MQVKLCVYIVFSTRSILRYEQIPDSEITKGSLKNRRRRRDRGIEAFVRQGLACCQLIRELSVGLAIVVGVWLDQQLAPPNETNSTDPCTQNLIDLLSQPVELLGTMLHNANKVKHECSPEKERHQRILDCITILAPWLSSERHAVACLCIAFTSRCNFICGNRRPYFYFFALRPGLSGKLALSFFWHGNTYSKALPKAGFRENSSLKWVRYCNCQNARS